MATAIPSDQARIDHDKMLIEAEYPEVDGWRRKVVHLWGSYFRVNFFNQEDCLRVDSYFLHVLADGTVHEQGADISIQTRLYNLAHSTPADSPAPAPLAAPVFVSTPAPTEAAIDKLAATRRKRKTAGSR
jgi:hypothetical protein